MTDGNLYPAPHFTDRHPKTDTVCMHLHTDEVWNAQKKIHFLKIHTSVTVWVGRLSCKTKRIGFEETEELIKLFSEL